MQKKAKKLTAHQSRILARLQDSSTAQIKHDRALATYEFIDGPIRKTIKNRTFGALIPYMELMVQVGLSRYFRAKRPTS